MALPSQAAFLSTIAAIKSYVDLSDEPDLLVLVAALLINDGAAANNGIVYPGNINQTLYLDAANGFEPVLYSRLYNETTLVYDVNVITLTGLIYVPVNPPAYIIPSSPLAPRPGAYNVSETKYQAVATTSEFTIGHELTKVHIFIDNVLQTPVWLNTSLGTTLTAPPVLPTQAIPVTNDTDQNLLAIKQVLDAVKVAVDSISTGSGNSATNSLLADTFGLLTDNFDLIDGQLTNINAALGTSDLKLADIVQLSTDIKTALLGTNTKLDASNTKLDTLITSVSTTNTTLSSINTEVSNLDTKVVTTVNGIKVDGSAVTQPVSAFSLPLPTGAATNAQLITLDASVQDSLLAINSSNLKLDDVNTVLNSINTNVSDIEFKVALESGGNLDSINSKLTTTFNGLKIDGSAVTQPISASSLPLPVGAATQVTSVAILNKATDVESVLTTLNNKFTTTANGLKVDNSAVTQPISAVSLPLPIGAATAANQENIKTKLDTLIATDFATQAKQDDLIVIATGISADINTGFGNVNTNLNSQITATDTVNTTVGLVNTKLTSTNTLLTTISNKDFATETSLAAIRDAILGNVNISESVWTDDSGTFFIRKVSFLEDNNTQTITFHLFNGTTYVPTTNIRPADKTLVLDQPLTDTQLRAAPVLVSGNFYQTTQPISATNLPLPIGAATSTLQSDANTLITTGNSLLSNISNTVTSVDSRLSSIKTNTDNLLAIKTNTDSIVISSNTSVTNTGTIATQVTGINTKIPANLTVTATRLLVDGSGVTQPISGTVTANTGLAQPLTDTQLRATAVPVSVSNASIAVTGTFFQATQPISATALPLPTGAATAALQTTQNTNIVAVNTSVGTVNTTLGTTNSFLGTIVTNTGDTVTQVTGINTKLPTGLTVTATRLLVDGSGVTQPISGTVTANTGLSQPLTDTQLRATPVNVIVQDKPAVTVSDVLLAQVGVCSVYISASGSGYADGAEVTFTGGTPIVAATGTLVVIGGRVIGINVTSPGTYTVAPTGVTAAGGTGLVGSINSGYAVQLQLEQNSSLKGFINVGSTDTVNFEVSVNGYTWLPIDVIGINGSGSGSSTNVFPYSFNANVSGSFLFRVRRTAVTSALVNAVYLSASDGEFTTTTLAQGLTNTELRAAAVVVSATSLPLPTGAATETTLSNINTKLPVLGQALNTGSVPVVLTASQLSTLTPLTTVAVTQSGAWTVTANTGLSQPLTDAQLRASAVPVTGTFFQATQPISATTLPLPTNAATETTLSAINTKTPTLGQALAAASVPVVLTAAQVSTLTPPAAITGFALDTTVNSLLKPASTLAAVTTIGNIADALPTGTNTIGSVLLTDGTTTSSVFNLTNSNPLAIALVDGVGNQVSSFGGGGTQYIDNQVVTSPTGTVSLGYDGVKTRAISVNEEGELKISSNLLDDTVVLLNRMLNSLIPLTNTDAAQRQLVALDAITTGLTLSTVSTVSTVSAVTSITNALPTGANTIGDVTIGGAGYELFMAQQRAAYNTSFSL